MPRAGTSSRRRWWERGQRIRAFSRSLTELWLLLAVALRLLKIVLLTVALTATLRLLVALTATPRLLSRLARLVARQHHAAAVLRVGDARRIEPPVQNHILTAVLALHDRADVLVSFLVLAVSVGVFASHYGEVEKFH
jgi:hypothetical protein